MSEVSRALRVARARDVRNQFMVAALFTGATPVPAAREAVAVETALCVLAVLAELDAPLSADTILIFATGARVQHTLRTSFEQASTRLRRTSGPLRGVGVSGVGAITAALQVFVVAEMAIALSERDGLSPAEARAIAEDAGFEFWRRFSGTPGTNDHA